MYRTYVCGGSYIKCIVLLVIHYILSSFPLSFILPAPSGSRDFIAANGNLIFSSNNSQQCIDITIVDDDVYEPSENFIVSISTSVTRVMLNLVTVTIVDNDGRGREGGGKMNGRK